MKSKKLTKKLALNKATISNLEIDEVRAIRGGYLATNLDATCYTWCAECYTQVTCFTKCFGRTCDCETIEGTCLC